MATADAGPRRRSGAATIGDVADAAGVSRATVSRVMNGRATVAADIAQRVEAAATRLRYRPSNVARSLSLGRTNTIALMVPDLGNPMFQQILRGVTSAAAPEGYRVLVADTGESPDDEAEIALEARQRCDALVLVSPRMLDDVLAELLPQVGPAVLVNRTAPQGQAPSVSVDYVRGMRAVVDHLVSLGHTRLVYLSGPARSASNSWRLAGLTEARLVHPEIDLTILECGPTVGDGYAVVEEVLATRATAVVAFNDLVAFGLLSRLNETGVAVPDDISIVGCDDIELARYATPSLTTLAIPQAELGRHAWHRLQDVITGAATAAEITRFEPRLEVRASTGPVPARLPASEGSLVDSPQGDRAPAVPGSTTLSTEDATADRAARSAAGAAGRATPRSPGGTLAWRLDGQAVVLDSGDIGDVALARYTTGQGVPAVHAPRPHLHPVRTLTGALMTETSPVDHRHHYGFSVAIPDVNGTSFWGGRTFVRDVGPTLLANHGQQVSTSTALTETPGPTLDDTVAWLDQHGDPLLTERRTLRGSLLTDLDGWALRWTSDLVADHGGLTITSPGAAGRPGAGYGGLFWRLSTADETHVLSHDGEGERAAHGSRSPWLALTQRRGERWTTLLLAQPGDLAPWFVRAATFPGAGPALAWDTALRVESGRSLRLDLVGLMLDRRIGPDEGDELAERLLTV